MGKTLTRKDSGFGSTLAREPVSIRLRDGRRRDRPLSLDGHAALLSELIHAGRPGYVEIVGAKRDSDGDLTGFDRTCLDRFVAAGDKEALLEQIRELRDGECKEVFLTPPTLEVPVAGNDSVRESSVVWVDIDEPRRLTRLRGFPHAPHAVVASGSGGVHAYWLLNSAVSGERCEEVNRKLAAALGADQASCNRGRILRVPGSFNWKAAPGRDRPSLCRVVMCDLAKSPYSPAVLTEGLRDPKAPRPARRLWVPAPRSSGAPWEEVEAAEYYQAIVGIEPRRDGKIRCPHAAHEDRHPSARLYSGPGAGWYCFACQAGGGAVDMIAAIRGYPTGRALRGEQFNECVAELERIFGLPARGRPVEGRQ
jgi:hypothetical protein